MAIDHLRRIGTGMRWAGYAANTIVVLVLLVLSLRLWGQTQDWLGRAGGLPDWETLPDAAHMVGILTSSDPYFAPWRETLINQVQFWGLAWVGFVFTIGMAALTVIGMRFLWVSLQAELER